MGTEKKSQGEKDLVVSTSQNKADTPGQQGWSWGRGGEVAAGHTPAGGPAQDGGEVTKGLPSPPWTSHLHVR